MAAVGGISRTGTDAERRFIELTGAVRAPSAAVGDALLGGRPVEIKKASSATINQVRAVKYIPLVVWDERTGQWFVVPPNEIVRLVAARTRGQHTENPFESSTLSLTALGDCIVEDPSFLGKETLDAIEEGDRYPLLREAMAEVLAGARASAARDRARVLEILARG